MSQNKGPSFNWVKFSFIENMLRYHYFSSFIWAPEESLSGTTLSLDKYLGAAGVSELRFCASLTLNSDKAKDS